MPARESSLVKRTKVMLARDFGAYFVKTCPPLEAGTPDLLCCIGGRFVCIELKAEGESPTALQYRRMEQVAEAGGVAIWSDDLSSLRRQLEMALAQDGPYNSPRKEKKR